MSWGADELTELRGRLSTSIVLLNNLNIQLVRYRPICAIKFSLSNCYPSSSQEAVQSMLFKFIDEIRNGRREDSVTSTNSLSSDEQEAWRVVRKELEDVGITAQLFIEHSVWIKETLQYLKETGALQEQPLVTQAFFTESELFEITSAGSTTTPISTDKGVFPETRIPCTAVTNQEASSYQPSTLIPLTSTHSNNTLRSQSNRPQPHTYRFVIGGENLAHPVLLEPPYEEAMAGELSIDKALLSDAANDEMLFQNPGSHQTKEGCEMFYCQREGCPRSRLGNGFTKHAYLIKHRPVHEPRDYQCPFCPSSNYPHLYSRQQSLKKHITTTHRNVDEDNPQLQAALTLRTPRRELMVLASGERFVE